MTEHKGFITNGTFIPTRREDLPHCTRTFGSRFIDELKGSSEHIRHKRRLIVQNFQDRDTTTIATKAQTVKRYSKRLLFSLAASLPHVKVFTRDITQAYIQSPTPLERSVYIYAPGELGLSKGTVLHVGNPLCGIAESVLHCYLTYLVLHVERLGMQHARKDPCVL